MELPKMKCMLTMLMMMSIRSFKDFVMTTPYQLNGTLVKDTDKYKNKIKKKVYVITSHEKAPATATTDDPRLTKIRENGEHTRCDYLS